LYNTESHTSAKTSALLEIAYIASDRFSTSHVSTAVFSTVVSSTVDVQPVDSLRFYGNAGGRNATFLLDCGAMHDVISAKACHRWGLRTHLASHNGDPVSINFGDGRATSALHVTDPIPYTIQGFTSVARFLVADIDLNADMVLGMTFFKQHNPDVDWCDGVVTVSGPQGEQHWLVANASQDHAKRKAAGMYSAAEMARIVMAGEQLYLCVLQPIQPAQGTSGQRIGVQVCDVQHLLQKYASVGNMPQGIDPCCCSGVSP
jgi:hypothetical protein